MQEDGEGLRVGGENGDFAGTAVEGLGDCGRLAFQKNLPRRARLGRRTLVGALLGLADVSRRLQEVENLLGQGGVSQRPSCEKS